MQKTVEKIEGTTIGVSQIVIQGDILTKGAQIMAIDALEITLREHQANLKVFPDAPVFGAQYAKHFRYGDFDVEVALIEMPSKVKAVVHIEFNPGE